MKKLVAFGLSFILLFSFMAGNVSASTKLEETVNTLSGIPYRWAGMTEKGFDCSGFTAYVFKKFGIDLPHSSKSQASKGYWIAKEDLRPGDLVFFDTGGSGISHVGIYMGNNAFIHSATNIGITTNRLTDSYYSKRYVSARRVLWDELYEQLNQEL